MRLTPGQVQELRSASNVRGSVIDGAVHRPLYRVAISDVAFVRAQSLTHALALPSGLVWYVVASSPGRVELAATAPEWFVELEERIEDARRTR